MYLFNFSLSLNTKNTILYICKDFSFAYMTLIRLVCVTKDISSFYI